MTLTLHRLPLKLAAAALAFVSMIALLRAIDDSGAPATGGGAAASTAVPLDATTDEQIAALRARIAEDPGDSTSHVELGQAYLAKVGETADGRFYERAEIAFREALRIAPGDFAATSGLGTLALARHQFGEGLMWGLRAQRINPTIASNYGVLTDARVELGRYGAAARTLQRWVNLEPGLSSYARVSYFRELHGNLPGALAAMKLAVSASGESSGEFSYLQTLVGDLHFDAGSYATAAAAYRSALAVDEGNAAAISGLAGVDAARGRLDRAIAGYREALAALPASDYALSLGEIEELRGNRAAAERAYARAGALIRRERPNGVDVDAELALFEADHGSPVRAVVLAERAWAVRPSVATADAYAWALHRAGRERAAAAFSARAMRLGSRDPLFLYRAGMIARASGDPARARLLLGTLLGQSPRFNPLLAPRARAALAAIG
jgi:tetratricopeptide (TPR) repeat protein